MATRKGRKLKLRRTARGHRKSTSGVLPVIDVRSKKSLAQFMKLIRKGKVTIILVYADWCGHCHHFMPHFDQAAKNPNRSIQAAKVNETMLSEVNQALTHNNHAATPINVEGYPSVILVDNQGKKITDVEPVKNTEVMTKVMNETGKLANNAGLSASVNKSVNKSVNVSASPTNAESLHNSLVMSTSIGSVNKRASPTVSSVNSVTTPNFVINSSADMGEQEGVSLTPIAKNSSVNNSKKESFGKNNTSLRANSAKSMEQQTEDLASFQGIASNSEPSLATPPVFTEDQEELESIREPRSVKGGSLYTAMSQTAYTLAAPAVLLATAALIMRRKTRGKHSNKKSHTKKSKSRKVKRSHHRR